MAFKVITVDVPTVGSAGSATGSADSPPLFGALEAVEIDYLNSVPATTTVDIDILNAANATGAKVLDKAASATDVTHYPRTYAQDNTGSDLTFDGTRKVPTRFQFGGRKARVTAALSDEATPGVRVRLIMEV